MLPSRMKPLQLRTGIWEVVDIRDSAVRSHFQLLHMPIHDRRSVGHRLCVSDTQATDTGFDA